MACRLSAVSVFQRISLAGRLSVSSNRDASNSTLASGVSGDLWGGGTCHYRRCHDDHKTGVAMATG